MNIVDKIVSAKYIVTIDQVEELGRQHTIAIKKIDSTGSTYLAVLIAGVQRDIVANDGQEQITIKLDKLHKEYYSAILKGIAATGSKGDEITRLATFARTTKSTLSSYVKAGGSFRELIPGMTSKDRLRKFIETNIESVVGNESVVRRSATGLIRKINKIAKNNIDEARRELQWIIDQMIKELNDLEDESETEVTSHNLERSEYRHNA